MTTGNTAAPAAAENSSNSSSSTASHNKLSVGFLGAGRSTHQDNDTAAQLRRAATASVTDNAGGGDADSARITSDDALAHTAARAAAADANDGGCGNPLSEAEAARSIVPDSLDNTTSTFRRKKGSSSTRFPEPPLAFLSPLLPLPPAPSPSLSSPLRRAPTAVAQFNSEFLRNGGGVSEHCEGHGSKVNTIQVFCGRCSGCGGGGAREEDAAVVKVAALHDFDGITPTPFNLFDAQAPFKPTSTPLHHLHSQLLPATKLVAPQQQSSHGASVFIWPRFPAQLIVLLFTVYHYFYVVVLEYSFALLRCEDTVISVVGLNGGGAGPTASVVSQETLVADRRVNCRLGTYREFRAAAVVLGSLVGAVLPLALLWLSCCGTRSVFSSTSNSGGWRLGGVQYLRDCCLAVLGLSEHFLWWESVTLLCKWALILMRHLIQSKNVVGLVARWTMMGYCTFLMYLQPFYDFFVQSLQVIVYVTLTVTAALQLLPLLDSATVGNGEWVMSITPTPSQEISGVLVVALPCTALAALLFIKWAITFSRRRWRRLRIVLLALGVGSGMHSVSHISKRCREESTTTTTTAVSSAQFTGDVLCFSFEAYNVKLVQQTKGKHTADDDGVAVDLTTSDQILQAVRGKFAFKNCRRNGSSKYGSGGFSLWSDGGVVGGLIGVANHVHLLSRFIHEKEGAVPSEAVMEAATAAPSVTTTTISGTIDTGEKESTICVDGTRDSALQPLAVMDREAEEELLTVCEHLRQLEYFVLHMEKALDRRIEQ